MATGGIVIPSGNSGTLVNAAENGHAEMLLNSGSSGRAFLNEFADLISARMSGGTSGGNGVYQFIFDGKILAEVVAPYYKNGIVRYKAKSR